MKDKAGKYFVGKISDSEKERGWFFGSLSQDTEVMVIRAPSIVGDKYIVS